MGDKKILIVDDDEDDVNVLQSLLKKEGYNFETATNGAEAMDFVEENKFDLILLDVQMPTLSGYDLLRLLKEKVKINSKIIYVTVVPKNEVNLEGSDGFIQKPFSSGQLLKEIRRIL